MPLIKTSAAVPAGRSHNRGDFNIAFVLKALAAYRLLGPDEIAEVRAKEASVRVRLSRERGEQGQQRYELTPVEVVTAFGFPVPGRPGLQLDEDKISEICALQAGCKYAKIDPLKLDTALITRTLSRPYASRHVVLPLEKRERALCVAVANPFDEELFDNLKSLVGCEIVPVLSSKTDILRAIEHVYGFNKSVAAAADQNPVGVELGNFEQLVRLSSASDRELDATDKPVVAAVEYLLRYAFDERASDIHIEPKRDETLIRMRIDGVLHAVHTVPKAVHAPIVARLKMLSRMDIAEKRKPQDGRIKTDRDGREVELRASTVPTAFGEKMVLRIFDPDLAVQDLSQIGFTPDEQQIFESWIERPHGLILVTGPTGSGKTTTLYSALKLLAGPEVNVTTIEDPIEMVFEGFNQIQVQPRIELDFAEALRHILRQDPDIIMVGEIRDRETAQNAIQAALTGHLVLSTLHTNDASDAVTRLLDLGVERFLVASSLIGVMAQRLVRVSCPYCSAETALTSDEVAALGVCLPLLPQGCAFRRSTGCPKCRNTGYSGRMGIYEMLDVDESMRQLIMGGASGPGVFAAARQKGMRTLRESGVLKLALGVTTFEEVLRVT
jgi:general secretion pathway protein E